MRIAIVGSRLCNAQKAVEKLVRALAKQAPDTIIVSGAARGVDSWAAQAARDAGLVVEEYPADWDQYGRAAGFVRNSTIVEKSDKIVAFWNGTSRGTADTMHKAKKAGKPVHVVMVNPL